MTVERRCQGDATVKAVVTDRRAEMNEKTKDDNYTWAAGARTVADGHVRGPLVLSPILLAHAQDSQLQLCAC